LLALGLAACGGGNDVHADGDARTCVPPEGVSASPTKVDDVVTLVNALRAEQGNAVTIPCVIESLDRPLGILAVESRLSLQPAVGRRSPRFFLFSGDLVMTVVPAGDGYDLMEISTLVSETRSVKAEIGFPVAAPLTPSSPYDRVRMGNATTCSSCHGFEAPSTLVTSTQAFESVVLRPRDAEEVDLAFARGEYTACDATKEKERCEMLTAIFGHGELVPRDFSPEARTIYDP
jgi:hypothetical protein